MDFSDALYVEVPRSMACLAPSAAGAQTFWSFRRSVTD
jgi:hypothetical protein